MITIIVITKNEEERIKTCLESVKWADQLIIADNGSTDKTLEIAEKYTNEIIKFTGQDFATLRNKAIEKAKGEWVLYIDADERVLSPLKDKILGVVTDTKYSAFALKRQNIIFGQKVNYGPYKHDYMIRLLKRSEFQTWVGKVHEYAKFNGELGYIESSLLHLTHRDLDHIVLKSLDWSHIDAKLRFDAKHPLMTGPRFIKILFTEIFNQGIKRRGFFGGTVGVMDSMLQVFSLFMTYVRLWQLQQGKSMDEIYEEIDRNLETESFKNF